MSKSPCFILAGNAPYENRGCEAITRGSTKIIRKYFKEPIFVCLSHSFCEDSYINQVQHETDDQIIHKAIYNEVKFLSAEHLLRKAMSVSKPSSIKYRIYRDMMPYIEDSDAVLSVGGDNYSLDYGIPKLFTGLDDIALSKNKPLILWGSSIGPFDSLPTYKPYILKHLQSATAILARESTTIEYLEKNGVKDNVYRVADPAYLLEPEKPADENKDVSIDDDSIGINFSPLMAKYACGRDMDLWKRLAAKIVCDIAKKTRRTIYLVPHVTTPDSNDYLFMRNMMSHIGSTEEVHLIGPTYNAAETKWIISKMSFFAGARTHSTIAALSSRVPTLSFAYSMKATGINKDLFGHNSYCLSPNMLDSNTVVEKVVSMIANEDKIIDTLDGSIPIMQEMAMNAGKYLVNVLEE